MRGECVGRQVVAALVVVLALSMAWGAAAQSEGADARVVVEDPTGDVQVEYTGVQEPAPEGFEHVDLVQVWMGPENVAHVEFGLELQSWTNERGEEPLSRTLRIHFSFADQIHRLEVRSCREEPFTLSVVTDPAGYSSSHVGCVPGAIDEEVGIARADVAKSLIRDRNGTSVRYGTHIDDVSAYASTVVAGVGFCTGLWNCTAWAYDRAPDTGAEGRLAIENGLQGVGHLQVVSPHAIRFSNGESTTLVYRVLIDNFGSEEDAVFLEAEDVPEEWDLRYPPRLIVPGGGSVEFPVIVSFGFSHRHGETIEFNLTAQSTVDPASHAWTHLGVHWPEIPQPAGHHNIVYLHSRSEASQEQERLWMNPLPEDPDPDADGEPVPSYVLYSNETHTYRPWVVPLVPGLHIGLDFDLDREGTASLAVSTGAPVQNGYVEAWLLHCQPGNETGRSVSGQECPGGSWHALASGQSTKQSWGGDTRQDFVVPLTPTAYSDLVPYAGPASNMLLEVRLMKENDDALGLSSSMPSAQLHTKETSLDLPLREYHDPIDQAYHGVGLLSLVPSGPFEKPVNPSETVVFPFNLTNDAPRTMDVALSAEGHNAEWARWAGEQGFALEPGEKRALQLVVVAPEVAVDGERAEVFAVASQVDDAAVVAISRLRASVVQAVDVPDEKDQVRDGDDRTVPGIPATMVLAILVAALAIRRGHRPGERRL